MKFVFLCGGAAGFLVAALTDFLSDRTPNRILLDGAIGCLVGALLFRWFWRVLLRGFRETYIARQKSATGAAEAAAAAAKQKP
jgi:xanthosine utilization system XapX-like protein